MPRQGLRAVIYAFGLPIALASCQRDATITIIGTSTTPEFLVEAGGGKTCVDRLIVYAVESENTNAPTSWGIGRQFGRGATDCRDRFSYGQTAPGYDTDSAAKPLIAGKRYRVEANGPGWLVASDWTP